ncbi:MAG: glycosyltransferase family 87 protein [bacterium]
MEILSTLRTLDSRGALKAAVGAWLLFALIVGIVVAVRPDKHTVTPEYRHASEKWWAGNESLYDMSQVGYLYLPQEAIIYTPYQVLPKRLGEPLWRWTGLALLASGLWRIAGLLNPRERERIFLAATLLVIPSALSSASNGQVNLPIAGLMLLTVADLAISRFNRTALWLVIAILLKPIALAPALLAAACFAPLRLRLTAGLFLALAAAYLHPSPAYVTGEYHHFLQKFALAGQPLIKDNFSDFFGMLWHWGIHPPPAIISGLRALAAGLTLIAALFAMRRFREDRVLAAFSVMLLAALYLMLFNPRTEENSFVMLGGFTALLSARDLVAGDDRRGRLLALFTLLLAVENYGFIYRLTRIWFKPLISAAFFITLLAGKFSLLCPPAKKPVL